MANKMLRHSPVGHAYDYAQHVPYAFLFVIIVLWNILGVMAHQGSACPPRTAPTWCRQGSAG